MTYFDNLINLLDVAQNQNCPNKELNSFYQIRQIHLVYKVTVFVRNIVWASFLLIAGLCTPIYGQYTWDWHDPNDLRAIDLGDNKVLVYNTIGLGLTLWLSKSNYKISRQPLNVSIGYFFEYQREPLSNLFNIGIRRNWSIRKFLSIGANMNIYKTMGDEVKTTGVGAQMSFLWHLVNSRNFRLSYDNGVGPNFFFKSYPFGGTKFSFTTYYGIKLSWRQYKKNWIGISFNNLHISNADISGRDRNPAFDAIGISLDYQLVMTQ